MQTWPYRYHPLPEAEAQDALAVAQYILHLKLTESAVRVGRDLDVMRPTVAQLFTQGCSITYRLHDFGVSIDLLSLVEIGLPEGLMEERRLPEESRYQEYAEKYFAYELTRVHGRGKSAQGNAVTFGDDLAQLLYRLREYAQADNLVTVQQSFPGKGGEVRVQVEIYPPKLAKVTLLRSWAYLIALVVGVLLVIAIFVRLGVRGNRHHLWTGYLAMDAKTHRQPVAADQASTKKPFKTMSTDNQLARLVNTQLIEIINRYPNLSDEDRHTLARQAASDDVEVRRMAMEKLAESAIAQGDWPLFKVNSQRLARRVCM